MKKLFGSKRRWFLGTVFLLAVLLAPFVFSRWASPWRRLSMHSTLGAQAARSRPAGLPLRIACYNIAHGRGVAVSNWEGGDLSERIDRLDQIVVLLRKIDADIVVLNEVDFDSSWSDSVNQARYLALNGRYPYWVEQRNFDVRVLHWTWRFGNAVLSRYPIANAEVVDLPSYSTWETLLAGKKRGAICDFKIGDQTVRVIGVHLSHRSETVRVRSAMQIAKIAGETTTPTMVAGDLNSTPPGFPESAADASGNNAIETLDNSGEFHRWSTNPPLTKGEFTFHSARPRRVIDWILIPLDWRFLQYQVEPSQLSDHRLAYADVAPASSTTSSATK